MLKGVRHAKCEGAVGRESCKTCYRTEIEQKQYDQWVVFFLRLRRLRATQKTKQRKLVESRSDAQPGKVKSYGRTKAGCREPSMGFSFAGRVESSSDSASPGGIGARLICNSENVSNTVTEKMNLTTWQKDVSTKRR